MIPQATIKHQLAKRLRLQIRTRQGDATYFEQVESRLGEALADHAIAASVLTGSLTIEAGTLDLATVRAVAEDQQLFSIVTVAAAPRPLAARIAAPIGGANRRIHELSGGVLDLPGTFFLLLLGFGLWELAIGNFRRPPWYTAFWYAFGLFSKSIYDQLHSDTQ